MQKNRKCPEVAIKKVEPGSRKGKVQKMSQMSRSSKPIQQNALAQNQNEGQTNRPTLVEFLFKALHYCPVMQVFICMKHITNGMVT